MSQEVEDTAAHERWMHRALELAEDSVGVASPNPAVGCVLVREGRIVGEGFHQYDQKDHAEVVALKQAGKAARGATAYVTLEPCCTTGRTGPCTQALIEAGVAGVVIATGDPNPAVSGKGAEQLRAAGIAVECGVLQREARRLNDGFARHIRNRVPFVTLKAALSLDGRIAPAPGSAPRGAPVYLTGEQSRAAVQEMRHRADAILTGINTVLQDDPHLTDRSGKKRRRRLLRVVLDSGLRIPLDSKLVRTAQDDLLIFCAVAPTQRQRTLEALGVRVERVEAVPAGEDRFESGGTRGDGGRQRGVSLSAVLQRLGEMDILSVLMEAGGQLNGAALAAGIVDRITLFYAPVFLGPAGVPLLQEMIPGILPAPPVIECIGQDVRIEAELRDPWSQLQGLEC
ncbi:MAG TPA: bifunctional diaminohydroxyphosphoribosylaminopyrimidine deaminase/5-amino-6-(5-phosphoribosylamino)uracil reductase RibD [Acidobacteriaceae bacterium]|nr:bifunctional diaminohydroxyphosphoribosylaminopyrimidine deaminase/5-amino-6-(5-phosphoribosylamino)uracil reductase RibD [Acidobacteriaceae bacterium]